MLYFRAVRHAGHNLLRSLYQGVVRGCVFSGRGGDPFALGQIENRVMPQDGDVLGFACFFVLDIDPAPENHGATFLPLA